jgi:drug/metabolite transporter (DMT)-like permease
MLAAIGFMLAAIAILPVMNVTVKYLAQEYSTTQLVWARYTGHLVFVLALFLPRHGFAMLRAHKPGVHIVRSSLMFLSTVMFFFGVRYIDVPVASSINFTAPLMVTALAVPFLGEKVGVRRWAAVCVGFAGALIVIRPGSAVAHWAMIFSFGSAVMYALYQVLTRRFATADSAETSVTYIALVGTAISTVALPFQGGLPHTWFDAALFALCGLIGALGHWFIIRAFRVGEASVLSPFNYGQLIMATAASYAVFGTLPDLWTWVGAGIIISSGLYITYRETVLRARAKTGTR